MRQDRQENQFVADRLERYIAEFEGLEPAERLELLLDFSRELPPLPPGNEELSSHSECKVNACQTPVFLDCSKREGGLHFLADVPEKSPTVRGFVAMLVNGLEGCVPEETECLRPELLEELGLKEVLGMTRVRGFCGILQRMRELALEDSSGSVGDAVERDF